MSFRLVGIVTPVRNRRHWSVDFVRRFLDQDYPFFKLYIVDSGSTDGTVQAIQEIGAHEVVVLDAPPSAYWTAATNIGVKRALQDGCEYILTMNDDAIVPADFLSRIVAAAQRSGERIVGAIISYADNPAKIWGVGAYNDWVSGAFVQTGLANQPEEAIKIDERAPRGLIPVQYLCGNGALFHRSIYEQIGLYDERNLPHYHADSEFTMRAERAGIPRWVASDVRLYNRFTDTADGVFAAKNVRFFSLRSANYMRAILFIVDQYCPKNIRLIALIRYLGRYLPDMEKRSRAKLLRVIHYLSQEEPKGLQISDVLPLVDPDLMLAEDVDLLMRMEPRSFVLGAYTRLLSRCCSDQELLAYENEACSERPRIQILREFISSAEFRNRSGDEFDFANSLVGNPHAATITARQAAILAWRERYGRNPTISEIDTVVSDKSAKRQIKNREGAAAVVYFNVDVPCMAIDDARARTGIHRYIVSVLEAMRLDPRIDLRIFSSPELEHVFESLLTERPEWRALTVDRAEPVSSRGVAFYPYFPFGSKNGELSKLPQAMTLCDLFPLTRPHWFAPEAALRFRQQLHGLTSADHIFCISRATEEDLHQVFPSLQASSSVAYLAAHNPLGVPKKSVGKALSHILKRQKPSRYFICVGTIEPRKNLQNVIAAFGRLGPSAKDVRMLVVGQQGWNITAGELLGVEKDIVERIDFLGRISDEKLWELYESAICTVFPSLAEGFGLPILESFRCGTPVVTSNTTSMPEIATKGAILVDPVNPDEIASAIRSLLGNSKLRERLSREGLDRSAEFSWEKCADDHIRVFLQLADPNARADQ